MDQIQMTKNGDTITVFASQRKAFEREGWTEAKRRSRGATAPDSNDEADASKEDKK